MKTWKIELAVVGFALAVVGERTNGGWTEAVGALAVLAAFGHAQVSERMREREALKSKPDVRCHAWSLRYFMAKELLWLAYFIAHRSWAALVGVGVFLLYPLWRKWWRARHPIARTRVVLGQPSRFFINGRQLDLMPGAQLCVDTPWSAGLVLRLDRSGCEFVSQLSRSQDNVSVSFIVGGGLRAADAALRRLQFRDSPTQRDVRFAMLDLAGIGELKELPSV